MNSASAKIPNEPQGDRQPQVAILVVDDNPIDRRLVGAMLEKSAGWKVHYAGDGMEALASIGRSPPHAVLTDLQMPELDGLELVEEVRVKHPTIPVVLMTAHGSEEIAIRALQKGAASYVPKRSLKEDLIYVLEGVLAAAEVEQRRRRVLDGLEVSEMHFRLPNDPLLIPPLVALFQENLMGMKICDENNRIRVGIALEEALVNAMHHGNLEVSSDLRRVEGDRAYQELVQQRRRLSPYQGRRLDARARVTRDEALYTIRDEGPGFDPATLPDPTDPANLEKPSGRGLLLIRTFMDEVRYNPAGNEITMVKRRAANT
jgi:CheY-like chemotaxis protein/anti-sigma regulatory factor (Ser/Thr protein kinase)